MGEAVEALLALESALLKVPFEQLTKVRRRCCCCWRHAAASDSDGDARSGCAVARLIE